MRLLLITPPFTQINTPYPATAHLTGYLRSKGYQVDQVDLGLSVILRLLSRASLESMFLSAQELLKCASVDEAEILEFFLSAKEEYLSSVEPVVRFLQGKDDSMALRIAARTWLPEGPRFAHLSDHAEILESFGSLGVRDRAKYLASLFIDDVADLIRMTVDQNFELSKYGEQLASSQASLDPLLDQLKPKEASLIDRILIGEVDRLNVQYRPDVVGLSCPFPGNVYGALKVAQSFKKLNQKIKIVMGGGYVNTELRDLSDPRFFDLVDFLTFDDGERPLEWVLQHLKGERAIQELMRVKVRSEGTVLHIGGTGGDLPFKELPAPDYGGLALDQYVSMMEMPNPMHRMWSDFRWNKMMLAHGCYWKKCTFCDVSLDYIGRYEPARVDDLISRMKSLVEQTGVTGFHFVDEAAPPALLKALSLRLKEERLPYTWWGNLRFDKQFTPELAELMAEAGCVAVTGGIEVASPRLLKLINKGVSIEQVAKVTKAFVDQGIFVHAYLMYGFPTQTDQETIDSLEVVRQLFASGCLHSAHWHRFVATVHSPVGKNPEEFGIKLKKESAPEGGRFAANVVEFIDPTPAHHDELGQGLRKAVYNFMHGIGLEDRIDRWFERTIPKPKVARNFIAEALKDN